MGINSYHSQIQCLSLTKTSNSSSKLALPPQSWQELEALITHLDENPLNRFLENLYEQVDQSDFSLSDWIAALLTFDRWLSEQEIPTRPVANMLSYIHCCTLTLADTLAPPNLAQLTEEMLKQHGFDAATDVSTAPED